MKIERDSQVGNQLSFTKEFIKALPVLDILVDNGYEAYFVGGSVRDALLGYEVNDVDIASSAQPEEVKALFDKTVDIGIEHGTVMVIHEENSYEITTFRTESTYKDFRRPDSVSFVRSLDEDLKRRDFTINAIAVDREGKVTDLFEGISDLNQQVISAVGVADERFNEDALRMMRAVRFAAQLDFDIDKDTKNAIKTNGSLLKNIAVERINVEWIKLLTSKNRKRGLDAMLETKLFEFCPKLSDKKMALMYLANSHKRIENERQAWALLLYYIRFMQPTNHAEAIGPFLRTWKTSNKMIEDVKILVEGLQERITSEELNPLTIYKRGLELSLEIEKLMDYLNQPSKAEEVNQIYKAFPIKSKDELQLTGHDLMNSFNTKPGPWLGKTIANAEENVVTGQWENDRDYLLTKIANRLNKTES